MWETLLCVQVVEELLSRSGALGRETAKSIADAAMLEVASISMGHMVRQETSLLSAASNPTCLTPPPPPQEPDEFYEGITFEHFLKVGICRTLFLLHMSSCHMWIRLSLQLLGSFEIESKMSIRFLNMDTFTLCK